MLAGPRQSSSPRPVTLPVHPAPGPGLAGSRAVRAERQRLRTDLCAGENSHPVLPERPGQCHGAAPSLSCCPGKREPPGREGECSHRERGDAGPAGGLRRKQLCRREKA